MPELNLGRVMGPIGPTGPEGKPGPQGKNFEILGYFDTKELLEQGVTSPEQGDTYGVGTAPPYQYWQWNQGVWKYVGNLQGPQGDTVVKVERTSGTGAAGTIDTYTMTMSSGSTFTFNVYNGADGQGAGDMLKATYDPNGKATDIFKYVDDSITRAILDSWEASY